MLRMTVGNISEVKTYEVAKADVIPSLPNKKSETTAQVMSNAERETTILIKISIKIFRTGYHVEQSRLQHMWRHTTVMIQLKTSVYQFYSL